MNFILPLPDNLLSLASFPPSSLSDPDGLTESGTNGTENGNLESVTSGTATFNTPTAGSTYLYSATEIGLGTETATRGNAPTMERYSPITWFSADLESPAPLSTNLLAIPARLSLVFVSSLLAHFQN